MVMEAVSIYVAVACAIILIAVVFALWIVGLIKVGDAFDYWYPEWVQITAIIIYVMVSVVILMGLIGIGGKLL